MDQQNTVLVIDDDLGFQGAVAELLRMEGYLVQTASDCSTGWNLITEKKPVVLGTRREGKVNTSI